MNYSVRIFSVLVALGLLVAVFATSTPVAMEAAIVAPAEDDAEWSDTSGNDITHIKPNSTSTFFIKDGALTTTKSGSAAFIGTSTCYYVVAECADSTMGGFETTTSLYFNISAASAGTSTSLNSAHGTNRTLTSAEGYGSAATSGPVIGAVTGAAATPLTGAPVVKEGTTTLNLATWDAANGSFTLVTGTLGNEISAAFSYDIQDIWTGSSTTLRRAKVTSTSDPAGEYVTISEVAAIGSAITAVSSTSTIYRGDIFLSSEGASQGTNSDGVWVNDGDTLTVSYLNSAGTVLDSDTIKVDSVSPTITGLIPVDGSITNVDNPTVQFDVTDSNSGLGSTPGSNITLQVVTGGPVTTTIGTDQGSVSYQAIADGYRAIFAQGGAWTLAKGSGGMTVVDSTEFFLDIVATDEAGNSTRLTGTSANLTIDKTKPTISSAKAAGALVTATFSEDLEETSIAASDFTVAGATVSAAAFKLVSAVADKNVVELTLAAALAPDAKPEISVSTVSDIAGNVIVAASKITATDAQKSTLSGMTVDKGLTIKADKVTTTFSTDEKQATGWPKVSVIGAGASGSNGLKTVTAPTPNNYSVAVTTVASDVSGTFGIAVETKDLGGNTSTNLTKVTDEKPTINTDGTITLKNGPIGDVNMSGGVETAQGADVLVKFSSNATTATSVGITISAIDASTRILTLSRSATTGSTVLVTYSYAGAGNTWEHDVSAPAVTFDPADATSVANTAPYIRLVFDEDEFPGDGNTTVTLTKAELTDPAGTTTDVLLSFSSADQKEFIYSGSDMALGKYTLKISAEDAALNKLTDKTSTFTLTKRTQTISLRPGWNLVSLADSPAPDATAINTVITSANIDIVLTYDARSRKWHRATRQTDGTLGQPGSSLELTDITADKAYWIHSTAIVSWKIDVPGISAGAAALPPSYPLVRGWNLVPYSTSDLTVTTRDADDYFTGLDWSRAYSYSNTTNKFVGILPDTDTDNEANTGIGNGYWVFLGKAGTLVP